MDIFVARQPILTQQEDVVGYELLYRNSRDNSFTQIDGDLATVELLLNSFVTIGNQKLSRGKKLYINFTRNLLLKKVPCLFSPTTIVIEVLETVAGDPEVLAAIAEYKRLGYTIALDDFILTDQNKGLIPYADVIKVDFLTSSLVQRKVIQNIAKKYNITLLAEKIETRTDFYDAINDGYQLFQGYFFSKPVIISSRDIPFYASGYTSILNELNSLEPCIDKITNLIQCDLSLSYKILKIVKEMAYYTDLKITSIKQGILILGLNELRKLISLISLKQSQTRSSLSNDIMIHSLTRAKLAVIYGEKLFGLERKSECFMLGMFSLLDIILQQPMEKALETLPLSDNLKGALLGSPSQYDELLQLIIATEKADWKKLQRLTPLVPPLNLASCQEDAIKWATEVHNQIVDDVANQ